MDNRVLVFWAVFSFSMNVFAFNAEQSTESYLEKFANSSRLSAQGEHVKAFTLIERMLVLVRLGYVTVPEQKCLVRMAILQWRIGNIPESLQYFEDARKAYRRVSDKRSDEFCSKCIEIIELYSQGKEERLKLHYDISTRRLEKAIRLGRETGFPDFELRCHRQLGANSWDKNQLADFLRSNIAGLELAVDFKYTIEEGRCLNNIGVYYKKTGYLSQAASYFERALRTVKLTDDRPTEAECLNNLGLLYRDIGDSSKALSFLSDALAIDNEIGDLKAVATDMGNLAAVSLRKGIDSQSKQELIRALDLYQRCLDRGQLDPYSEFVALNNIGIVLNEQGMHKEARGSFIRAIQILGEKGCLLERCSAQNNIASTYLYEHDHKSALRNFQIAKDMCSTVSPSIALMESYVGMGQCYENQQDDTTALACYQRATDILDGHITKLSSDVFMIGYARNKYSAYHNMLKIHVDEFTARPSRAVFANLLSVIERAKAKAFLENLRRSMNGANLGDQGNSGSERHSARTLNVISGEQEEGGNEEPSAGYLHQIELDRRINPDGLLEETQKSLIDDKTLVVEYFIGDERSYLISITSEAFKLYLLPGKAEITRTIRGFLKLLSDIRIKKEYGSEANERIARLLFPSSLIAEMKRYRALVIMPDGVLNYLPFEALRIPREKDSQYMIESWTISYCPSVSVMKALLIKGRGASRSMPILAIGGVQYSQDSRGYSEGNDGGNRKTADIYGGQKGVSRDLPFSGREVSSIARLFSKSKVRILLGSDASEKAVKSMALKEYRIIHFACHGYYDEIDPFKTALALTSSPTGPDDGFLRIEEISEFEVGADLVVLSACRSGRGYLENGEGLINLARPFFFAGARSVIASLWPINDRSTARFMEEFYNNVKNNQRVGEALRNAKIGMIKSSLDHPFFWAGFVLHGNPAF